MDDLGLSSFGVSDTPLEEVTDRLKYLLILSSVPKMFSETVPVLKHVILLIPNIPFKTSSHMLWHTRKVFGMGVDKGSKPYFMLALWNMTH